MASSVKARAALALVGLLLCGAAGAPARAQGYEPDDGPAYDGPGFYPPAAGRDLGPGEELPPDDAYGAPFYGAPGEEDGGYGGPRYLPPGGGFRYGFDGHPLGAPPPYGDPAFRHRLPDDRPGPGFGGDGPRRRLGEDPRYGGGDRNGDARRPQPGSDRRRPLPLDARRGDDGGRRPPDRDGFDGRPRPGDGSQGRRRPRPEDFGQDGQ